ncbi:hypothetical protein IHE45_05G239000 [Dioscorea alata]|uniref:Uncharacterized protein n=1 Tax=Dioscorea alata TaxID=55571 RepID=A0ACB7WAA0_DIOAL|nr:hypothetical protein IHE45_05G239000 [Dioscorea alata]
MGSCISSSFSDKSQSVKQPTARVVAVNGSLQEFPIPVSVSDVLDFFQQLRLQDPFFICSSDTLFYDEHIPRMKLDDSLVSGQIYFVLHSSMLDAPLTSLDMASLALKASCALASAVKLPRLRRTRVLPTGDNSTEFDVENRRFNEATLGVGVDHNYHSTTNNINKRMKMGTVSMRMRLRPSRRTFNSSKRRLPTIDEVDE